MNWEAEMVSVQESQKFAIGVINVSDVDECLPDEVSLGDGLTLSRALPILAASEWGTWMNNSQVEGLTDGGLLFLAAVSDVANSSILDHQNEFLMNRVSGVLWSLIVRQPTRVSDDIYILGGLAEHGRDPQPVTVKTLPAYGLSFGVRSAQVSYKSFEDAVRFENLGQRLGTAMSSERRFTRVGRAIMAFEAGLRASPSAPWERLHQMVRTIDGFIYTKQGKGAEQFTGRCSLFVGAGNDEVLRQCYQMRSKIEHLHGWQSVVPDQTNKEAWRVLNLRTCQVEAIARHVVNVFHSNEDLWPEFESDEAVSEFWDKKSDATRASRWPAPPLDLQSIEREFDENYVDESL